MKKRLTNIKDSKRIPAMHGECFLKPIEKMPEGETTKHKLFIVGHSETGHHHVLESKAEFDVMSETDKQDLYIRLFEPAKLVHKKSFDVHETEIIAPGDYAIFHKTEYDPFADVVRAVYD